MLMSARIIICGAHKEPAIGGVMRENYVLRCVEKLMEIREMPVLLRSPRQKKTAGKGRRRGSGSCCCKADAEDTDTERLRVKMTIF